MVDDGGWERRAGGREGGAGTETGREGEGKWLRGGRRDGGQQPGAKEAVWEGGRMETRVVEGSAASFELRRGLRSAPPLLTTRRRPVKCGGQSPRPAERSRRRNEVGAGSARHKRKRTGAVDDGSNHLKNNINIYSIGPPHRLLRPWRGLYSWIQSQWPAEVESTAVGRLIRHAAVVKDCSPPVSAFTALEPVQ